METEARHENCLHTQKEPAEAEASENVQEQVEALQWSESDLTALGPREKLPVLPRLQFRGTRTWWSPTTACAGGSCSPRTRSWLSSAGLVMMAVYVVHLSVITEIVSVPQILILTYQIYYYITQLSYLKHF